MNFFDVDFQRKQLLANALATINNEIYLIHNKPGLTWDDRIKSLTVIHNKLPEAIRLSWYFREKEKKV